VVRTILVYWIFWIWHHGHNIICELVVPLSEKLADVDQVSTLRHT
jgi:hypothetical protein